jgi:hypothetical protein
MWNLAKICVIVAICLGATGGAGAATRPKGNAPLAGSFRPMAVVSVPNTPLEFGTISGPGPMRLKAEVTAHVVANCPFRLAASFQGLTEAAGKKMVIPPAQIAVTINGKELPVGTDCVQIATGGPTPPTGVNVPVVIEMVMKAGASLCRAGRYGGNLVLTVKKGS